MRVSVNGRAMELAAQARVVDVIADLGMDPEERGVAVAMDGEVVPRARWATTGVPEGARVEVVRATAGG